MISHDVSKINDVKIKITDILFIPHLKKKNKLKNKKNYFFSQKKI
jgi:hypothetical protein